MGHDGTNWELDFRQCSFHHIMQVLRVCAFCAFSSPPAFPPCSCSLAFRHQVRRLTFRISSESYPGSQECVANCHVAAGQSYAPHTAESAIDRAKVSPKPWDWAQAHETGCCSPVGAHLRVQVLPDESLASRSVATPRASP